MTIQDMRCPLALLVVLLAFLSLSSTIAQQGTDPWAMFRRDARHTGRSPYQSLSTLTLAWSYFTGYAVDSSPAIGQGGSIYAGSDSGRLYAIDSAGSLLWSYIAGGAVLTSPALGSDGSVYVGSDNHRVYALGTGGSLSWTYATGLLVESNPAVGEADRIYIGSDDRRIYALNSTGSLFWSYRSGSDVISSPATAPGGNVTVGSLDMRVYSLSSSGSFVWSYLTGGGVFSSPSLGSDGSVYVGSLDSRTYALNSSGALAWSYLTGLDIDSSPAIGPDGNIYIGSFDNNVYAFTSTGTLAWSHTTGDWVFSSPAVDVNARAHVGSEDNTVYALNSTGSLAWSFLTGAPVDSSPAIGSDGRVCVGSGDGTLYLFSDPSPTPTITSTPTATPTPIRKLAVMKEEGDGDINLYYYNSPAERDWTYWDALSRNPFPYARDLWMIPGGNNVLGMAAIERTSPGGLFVLKRGGEGDVNLYLYDGLVGGDWSYWDAAARNPSPLARDLWSIPSGNSLVDMASVDITGDEAEELAVLKRTGTYDMNIYYYNAPVAGDWTYWDAASRNPSPLARDLWVIPSGNGSEGIAAVLVDGGSKKLAMLGREPGGDLNLYLYNNPLPGDWTYWDAVSRNPSLLARDLWLIPSGNDAMGIAALNMDAAGNEELALLKGDSGGDINLYCYRSPVPGDWTYWDALYRNPVPLARDLWIIPQGNDTIGITAIRAQ